MEVKNTNILNMFIYLISILRYKGIITPHLQNVSIKQRLQNRSGEMVKNDLFKFVQGKLLGMKFQLVHEVHGIQWLQKK